MSEDVLYANNPPLLTLKGQIAVHFLDGAILEGDFATQDAFNIFLTVEDEPVMVPRQQIRYIKGTQAQPIEADTSQQTIAAPEQVQAEVASPDSFKLAPDDQTGEEEDHDGKLDLRSDKTRDPF